MIQLEIDESKLNDSDYVLRLVNGIILQKLIEGFDIKYKKAFDFYDGKEPTTSFEDSEYEGKVINLTKPIVDIATKTFIGEIPDIVTSGKKPEKDKISVLNQKLYNRQYHSHIYETLHYSSKCGTGFIALYNLISDTFPRFRELNPRFTECVYNCSLDRKHLLSYYIVQMNEATSPSSLALSKYVIYVYTKERIYAFESPTTYTSQTTQPNATKDIIIKPYFAWKKGEEDLTYIEHDFGDIPIVEFPNNAEYQGDAECVFDLIALYNQVTNNRCKNLYDIVNYVLMIKNVRLGDEEETKKVITLLKENHVLPVEGDNVDAKFLTNPIDQAQLQKLADNLKDLIHLISRVPDLSGVDFSQNASDPVIKIKTKPLLDLCNDKEKQCDEPYMRVLRMVLHWCKKYSKDYDEFDVDLDKTRLEYTHTLPSNDTDMALAIATLQNSNMANPEVLLQNLTFVKNVHEYIKGMDKWNKDVVDLQKEKGKNNNGINETNLDRQNAKINDKNSMDNEKNFIEGISKNIKK